MRASLRVFRRRSNICFALFSATSALCSTPNVANGFVDVGSRLNYPIGSSITIKCNPDRDLVGQNALTCVSDDSTQATARWSPDLPSCEGQSLCNENNLCAKFGHTFKFVHTFCTTMHIGFAWFGLAEPAVQCPELVAPANGQVEARTRTVGSQAAYQCLDGYRLTGGDTTRTCLAGVSGGAATWSGTAPTCAGVSVLLLLLLLLLLLSHMKGTFKPHKFCVCLLNVVQTERSVWAYFQRSVRRSRFQTAKRRSAARPVSRG